MKISLLFALPALTMVLALGGCDKTPVGPDSAVLFQTIQDNVKAMEKKDVDAVMATIHPQSLSFAATRELATEMFKAIDVKYTLSDLKVVTSAPEEARVGFVQKMEKTGGAAPFQNNIVEGIHILRPDNGKWKIFDTIQIKVTDLNGKLLGVPGAGPEPEPAAVALPVPSTPPPPAEPAASTPPATPAIPAASAVPATPAPPSTEPATKPAPAAEKPPQ